MPKIDYTMFQGSFNEELHEMSKLKAQLKIPWQCKLRKDINQNSKKIKLKMQKGGCFIYSFVQEIFTEHQLCVNQCAGDQARE